MKRFCFVAGFGMLKSRSKRKESVMIKYFLFLFLFAAGCAHSMVEPEAGPIDDSSEQEAEQVNE